MMCCGMFMLCCAVLLLSKVKADQYRLDDGQMRVAGCGQKIFLSLK